MYNAVSSLVSSVTSFFNQLWNIDLFGAGQAILQGFLNGLQSMWSSVTDFVGGIAGWIRDHKGPIDSRWYCNHERVRPRIAGSI